MINNQILLLKTIHSRYSLMMLRKKGLTHSQIALLLNEQIQNGLATYEDNIIVLTNKGISVLEEQLNTLGNNSWILPQESYYNKPISKNAVILPRKIDNK